MQLTQPRIFLITTCFLLCFFFSAQPSAAFTISSDPQYVVMNFSTINEFNWAAPETEWQQKIKPQVLEQLHELTQALPPGTSQRQLAWSTLQEYMNTPLDTPSESSVYAVKMKRILEVAEEVNLPVFLPLNGFQWWDELPELYNWWDPDGTHTPAVFFDRQKTADFKQRFISGYNPNNQWNVEWQSFTQPMNLNWRNWGGGGFRLAPPPNLVEDYRAPISYREVQAERYKVLLQVLAQKLAEWEKTGKSYLFAGLTIGTEVSLNASVTAKDEFQPYGYRGVADELCPLNEATCGAQLKLTTAQMENTRSEVVSEYLNDLARTAVNLGIPKQRIYTHVWSEALDNDPRHSDYATAAWNLYSRPGISLYGFADKPFALPDWQKMIAEHGFGTWGAVEYSVPKDNVASGVKALQAVLDSPIDLAKVVTLYNWSEHKDTPAIGALQQILSEKLVQTQCTVPEVLPVTPNYAVNPKELAWKILGDRLDPRLRGDDNEKPEDDTKRFTAKLHLRAGITEPAPVDQQNQTNAEVPSNTEVITAVNNQYQINVPALPEGVYTWYIEVDGCTNHQQFSQPQIMIEAPKQ